MDNIPDRIVSAAEEVHEELGPGWTESVYHRSMENELSSRGIGFTSEATIPIFYKGKPVGRRRPDIIVESGGETIVVELKAGSNRGEEQLQSYQSLLGGDANFDIDGGILIKFNEDLDVVKTLDL